MKHNRILFWLLSLFFMLLSSCVFVEGLRAQPGEEASSGASVSIPDIKASPGTELQSSLFQLANPVVAHGLMVTLQGGVDASERSRTFGFDDLSIRGSWTPETDFERVKFSVLLGGAEWFTPAPSKIYPEEYLSEDEKKAEGLSENIFMGGLAITFGDRLPTENDWEDYDDWLEKIDLEIVKAREVEENENLARDLEKQRTESAWDKLIYPALRSLTIQMGALFRADLADLDLETEAAGVDLFLGAAKGWGRFDFAASLHGLLEEGLLSEEGEESDDLIARWALNGNMGVFMDMKRSAPSTTLGLTFGLGRYNYAERPLDEKAGLDPLSPEIWRADILLSLSSPNLGDSGFGVRYTRLWTNQDEIEIEDDDRIALIFSSHLLDPVRERLQEAAEEAAGR